MKNAFRKMCVTIYGRFCPDEGVVAGYGNRIWTKYTAKWGVQAAEMVFQSEKEFAARDRNRSYGHDPFQQRLVDFRRIS